MALSDYVLRAKINNELTREARFREHQFDVRVENGAVTLAGEGDAATIASAESLVRGVEGVASVRVEMNPAPRTIASSAAEVSALFLNKLEMEWKALPDQTALTQADYVRWALWMTTKFHFPAHIAGADDEQTILNTIEQALQQISGCVHLPAPLLALEMLRQAETLTESVWRNAPESGTPTLSSSPATTINDLQSNGRAAV